MGEFCIYPISYADKMKQEDDKMQNILLSFFSAYYK